MWRQMWACCLLPCLNPKRAAVTPLSPRWPGVTPEICRALCWLLGLGWGCWAEKGQVRRAVLGPLLLEIFNWHPKNKHLQITFLTTYKENKLVLNFCWLKGGEKKSLLVPWPAHLIHFFFQSVNSAIVNLSAPRSLCWVLVACLEVRIHTVMHGLWSHQSADEIANREPSWCLYPAP